MNRTNRSGIIDKAGPIGGLNQDGDYSIDCRFNKTKLIDQIKKLRRIEKIALYNMEALDLIDNVILKTRKSFTFLIRHIIVRDLVYTRIFICMEIM